jgi:hypothetical protein
MATQHFVGQSALVVQRFWQAYEERLVSLARQI